VSFPPTRELVSALDADGYVVVPGALEPAELSEAEAAYDDRYPGWDELATRLGADGLSTDAVGAEDERLRANGPFGSALDRIPLHPAIAELARAVLGPEAKLVQSHLWAKYGHLAGSYEQPLHLDYPNHTIVYPSDDPRYAVLQFIVYYSNVTEATGPTCVVSRQVSAGDVVVPSLRPGDAWPDYYDAEVTVTCPAGSVLVYTPKTLHRVRAMTDASAHRKTHFFAYAQPDVPWVGWGRWLCAGHGPERQRLIESASRAELAVLGFPPADSPYWTSETIRGTQALYPGIDLTGYLAAESTSVTAEVGG
jgi:ectoine hydroxylase-related dioxygenase (phytanoyl-CoA dioxygenase family)